MPYQLSKMFQTSTAHDPVKPRAPEISTYATGSRRSSLLSRAVPPNAARWRKESEIQQTKIMQNYKNPQFTINLSQTTTNMRNTINQEHFPPLFSSKYSTFRGTKNRAQVSRKWSIATAAVYIQLPT